MDLPKISVIIPVYNTEEYLEECLASIVKQTYKNIEIVIVNDGSTDNSPLIIADFVKKFSFIKVINQENKGLSVARNAGVSVSTGDYISFIDSDDWIDKMLYENIVKHLKQLVDLIAYDHTLFYPDNTQKKVSRRYYEQEIITGKQLFIDLIKQNSFQVASCFHIYSKEFIYSNNLYFKEGLLHEDVLFTPIAYAKARTAICLEINGYYYRQRPISISNSFSEKHASNFISIIKSLSAENINKDSFFNYYIVNWYFVILDKSSFNKDIRKKIGLKLKREIPFSFIFRLIIKSYRSERILPKLLLFFLSSKLYFSVFKRIRNQYR